MSDGRRGRDVRKSTVGAAKSKQPEHGQLGLFETEEASSVARHWPGYVVGDHQAPEASALVLWAESFSHLPRRARTVLVALARQAGTASSCRTGLRSLPPTTGMGRNTCKRHLETLLASGLVMMKVWSEGGSFLGYEFRFIVDVDDRSAAVADGFTSSRIGQGQP